MPIRYCGSVAGGAVVTAVLVYSMQWLISGGDFEVAPVNPPGLRTVSVRPPVDPPRPPPRRPRPLKHVAPPPSVPHIGTPSEHTDGRIVIGPLPPRLGPGPLFPPGAGAGAGAGSGAGAGAGSGGPWTADGGLRLVTRVPPVYPHAAIARNLEGRVTVEFTVTERGAVRDARIVASSDRAFERAALTAVARFRYRPRIVGGRAVAVAGVRAEIVFELEN